MYPSKQAVARIKPVQVRCARYARTRAWV